MAKTLVPSKSKQLFDDGFTLIMTDSPEFTSLLKKFPEGMNMVNEAGNSWLDYCVVFGHHEQLSLLLSFGSAIKKGKGAEDGGMNPLFHAILSAALNTRIAVAEMLIHAGCMTGISRETNHLLRILAASESARNHQGDAQVMSALVEYACLMNRLGVRQVLSREGVGVV